MPFLSSFPVARSVHAGVCSSRDQARYLNHKDRVAHGAAGAF